MGKKFIKEEKLLEIVANKGPIHPYKIAKIIIEENPNLNPTSVLTSVQRSLKNMEKKTLIVSKETQKIRLLKRKRRIYGLTLKGLLSLSPSFEEMRRLVEVHKDFICSIKALTETYRTPFSLIKKPHVLEQEFLIDFIKSSKKNYEVVLYLIDRIKKIKKFENIKNVKLVKYLFNIIFNAVFYQKEFIVIDKSLQKEIYKYLKKIDYRNLSLEKYIIEFIRRSFDEYSTYLANLIFDINYIIILLETEKFRIDNKEALIKSLRDQLIGIGETEENGMPILYYFSSKYLSSLGERPRFKNLSQLFEILETLIPELEKDEKYKEYVEKLKQCIV